MRFLHEAIFLLVLVLAAKGQRSRSLTQHAHPYMISLQGIESTIGWQHICTGVLLTPSKVLTSGACAALRYPYIDLYPVRIAAGMDDPMAMGSEIQAIDLHKGDWNFHPKYELIHEDSENKIFNYDFAIISLQGNFTLNDKVQTIKLKNEGEVSDPCEYITWGIPESPSVGRELRNVNVTLVNHAQCSQEGIEFVNVTQNMICAAQEPGHRLHFGHRGDGLFCRDDVTGESYLAGINSWNINYFSEPQAKFKEGLFANIFDGLEWISSQL